MTRRPAVARRRTGDGAGKPAPSTLPFTEQVAKGREHALRLLAIRERSAMEIRIRLRQRGYAPEAIVAILERLQGVDLQSDRRYADRFATEAAARGKSSRLIQGELRGKGVEPDLAAQAAAASDQEDRARALALARKKALGMRSLPPEVRSRRILGMLARRGYDPQTCRLVAAEVSGRSEDDLDGGFLDPDSEPDVP